MTASSYLDLMYSLFNRLLDVASSGYRLVKKDKSFVSSLLGIASLYIGILINLVSLKLLHAHLCNDML